MANPAPEAPSSAPAGGVDSPPAAIPDDLGHPVSSLYGDGRSSALGVLRALIRRFGATAITLAITLGSVVISMAAVALFDRAMKGHIPLVDLVAGALIPTILAPIATYGFARLSQELDRAEEQVRALASHDSLTGVLNHRQFIAAARTELERLARYGRVATLIFIDVDRFKNVNDRLGHAAGDRALVEIAAACRALLRGSDLIGRCGGDEFLMLISETSGDGAMIVAERVRATVEALVFETPAGRLQPTVSIGIATSGVGIPSFDLLYQRADGNLYLAKDAGRNQVVA